MSIDKIKLDRNAAKSIDEYWEYKKIVGDDDNGKLFTPEEYARYKREVLPMRFKNRLYVAWTNSTQMDCILIGPETMCFCQHRYKNHQTDFKELPKTRPILLSCKELGCPCASFEYIPRNGTQFIKCSCKHASDDHKAVAPFMCRQSGCKCNGFRSSYTCNCGEPTYAHRTIVETKEEREARGHPVGYDVPYKAMGGLTGFSSLAEGYLRLDPSGRGKPDDEFLTQPVTMSDHPFIRQYAHLDVNANGQMQLSNEAKSQLRQPEESELDFYERRYKERIKLEKTSKPKPIQSYDPYDPSTELKTGNRVVRKTRRL